MATGQSFLEEYLVKLGFNVNTDGIRKFFSAVDEGRNRIDKNSKIINNALVETISTYTGLVAKAAESTLMFAASTADFDKQMELNARKMWMSKDAYMALTEAVESLGYSLDDIGTIALDPELSSQFKQLYSMSKGFQNDYANMAQSLTTMREFEFQFKKLNLIGKYFLQLVGAGLVKYFEGPLGQANSSLSDIISKLQKDMPKYVDMVVNKVGPFIELILKKGKDGLEVVKKIYSYFEKNPEALKKALKIISLIYAFLNPLQGTAILIFSTISDYLADINDGSVDMEEKWGSIGKLIKSAADLIESVYNWVIKIIDKLNEWGLIDKVANIFSWLSNALNGKFLNIGADKKPEEMTTSEKAGAYLSNGVKFIADSIENISDAFSANANNGKIGINQNLLTPEFRELLKSFGYDSFADFMKTDYYRQITEQTSNVDNSNKTINITNNYSNVSGNDARRLSDEQIEQFNAALANLSY